MRTGTATKSGSTAADTDHRENIPIIKASTLGLIAGFRKRTVEEHIKCSLCVERLKAPRSSAPATAVIFNLDGVGYLIRGFSSWNSSVHWKERPKHSQNLRYPTKNRWRCL